jgi:hypothetical protein
MSALSEHYAAVKAANAARAEAQRQADIADANRRIADSLNARWH